MNNKSIINLFFILLCFVSLNCSKNDYDGRDLTFKDGLLFRSGDKNPFTGKVKDHLNGKILEYEVKDGMKDGKYILRLSNGTIEIEGNIVKNKNEGIWSYYYPNGSLESRGVFKNDLVEGKWYWYYPDGKIKEEANFNNGLAEGDRIIYNMDGSVNKRITFEDNKAIDTVFGK